MKRLLVPLISAMMLVSLVGASSAAIKTFTDSTGVVDTGWSGELRLQQFDPAWGTLNDIRVTYEGRLIASVSFENRDRRPATISTTVASNMTIGIPRYAMHTIEMAPLTRTYNAEAYDGVLDFGGTSGHTYADHVIQDSIATASLMYDSEYWKGSNFVIIPVDASGTAYGSGAANLVLAFGLQAVGTARVDYYYTPVPEPSGLLTLLPGAAGLVGAMRFRRRK
mgnify:CR=1 FL=1